MQIKIIAGLMVLVFLAGMALYVQNLRQERDDAKADLKTVQTALDNTQRVNAAQREAIVKSQAKAKEQYDAQQKIRNQIHASPAGDDGPAAPVLSRTLDGLREHQGIN